MDHQDAFGHALLDQLRGQSTAEIIERSDGYVDVAARDLGTYLRPFAEWPAHERAALDHVRGRALDVGCGGGRVLLALQERGIEAVGIDVSPLALEVCRTRGAKDVRLMSITEANEEQLGRFDAIVMMGNNFGLLGGRSRAKRILRAFHRMTSGDALIVAEVIDPYRTDEPFHLAYQEANRAKGRLSGQLRIRVRYKRYRTPWFDYLFVSADEMRSIVEPAGWRVDEVLESGGPVYIGVLRKT